MKKKERADHISTLLGIGTTIEGTLEFKDTIRLDGAVNGKIFSEKGTVIIGERAVVEAQIRVGTAIVKGTVNGHIQASDRIEVYPPAKITGDIQAPVISIETGVFFNGNCSMDRLEPLPVEKKTMDARRDEKKSG
ncbi:MAG: polymer-forming cytoskeletal protein [Desulfosarcina sp.]|nr:polymer-forming cytoskeletal protein [Desulfosarcina sp.]MBC2764688.1 polymer-forming cytoskeletal protein [Desulfosarcina sp.]